MTSLEFEISFLSRENAEAHVSSLIDRDRVQGSEDESGGAVSIVHAAEEGIVRLPVFEISGSFHDEGNVVGGQSQGG